MKRILLAFTIILSCTNLYSQCTPNPLYQDSTYSIWPDTVTNLPTALQGVFYEAIFDIKTPGTLLEATGGDSSILYLDTMVMGIQVYEFVGGWPVDSMELVSVSGLPTGLSLGCDISNCVLPGDYLTCAYVNGTTNDNNGVYPITVFVNVYTHGVIDLGFIQYPYSTDLYSALGNYEEIGGYKIVVSDGTGVEIFNSQEFSLLQNIPNPMNGVTEIRFNIPKSEDIILSVTDILGNIVYSKKINAHVGLNSFIFDQELSSGTYTYSIMNNQNKISKTMIISR